MPILDDILQHRVFGREYKRGRLEGELKIIRMQKSKGVLVRCRIGQNSLSAI